MQPYFFPYLGYFQLIKAVDKFILYERVQYIRKGWVNRNRIIELNKGDIFIGVPIKKKETNPYIFETEIDNSSLWGKKIINLLFYNYKKSPFFEEIYPFFENIFNQHYDKICKMNIETIKAVVNLLGIETQLVESCQDYLFIEEDLKKNTYSLDVKTQRVVSICKYENADIYVNAIGGMELYKKEDFIQNDIDMFLLKTKDYTYHQHLQNFIPHLSIIDVLFNNGISRTKELLNHYELI